MANSVTFTVAGVMAANGSIIALRVQDVDGGGITWYNWDNGSWDSNGTPKCKNGGRIYVAAYAQNIGGSGKLTLIISSVGGTEYTRKTETVAAGAAFGAEWNGTMPATGNLEMKAQVNVNVS